MSQETIKQAAELLKKAKTSESLAEAVVRALEIAPGDCKLYGALLRVNDLWVLRAPALEPDTDNFSLMYNNLPRMQVLHRKHCHTPEQHNEPTF